MSATLPRYALEPDLLEASLELSRCLQTELLHHKLVHYALQLSSARRALLVLDEMGALRSACLLERGGEVQPLEEVPEGLICWVDGGALGPLAAAIELADQGLRQGLLFLEYEAPPPAGDAEPLTALAPHAAASLANVGNYHMLEELVEQEMAAAVRREESIRLILDSMSDGLLVCGLDGALRETRSASVEAWLGDYPVGGAVWDYLAGEDRELALTLELAVEMIAEDFMPFEVTVDQIPDRVCRRDRTYGLGYRQVYVDGVFQELLITVRDITDELARERTERLQRELPIIVGHIVRDRRGFESFIDEAGALLEQLEGSEDVTLNKRLLHTLKGNTALYGFASYASEVHHLEDRYVDDPSALDAAALAALRRGWEDCLERIRVFRSQQDDDTVQLTRGEHRDFHGRILPVSPELAAEVEGWVQERAAVILGRFERVADRLARRLGKRVDVRIDAGDVRSPGEHLAGFFSALIHVVRNAVDHGLEPPEERAAAGKSEVCLLELGAKRTEDTFTVWVADDGRGIDWEKVCAKGRERGLDVSAERGRLEALFSGSTRDEVSEISGRGVGMGAARAACLEAGGAISVESEPGRGTRFSFVFPL